MDLKLLIALTALFVAAECKKVFPIGQVTIPPKKFGPPCENNWAEVCRWGCKARKSFGPSFTIKRGRRGRGKCLNCECKTAANGLKYTTCIKPMCEPLPSSCKKPVFKANRCCGKCEDEMMNQGNGGEIGNAFGGKPTFTFPPSEFGGAFPRFLPFGDETDDVEVQQVP